VIKIARREFLNFLMTSTIAVSLSSGISGSPLPGKEIDLKQRPKQSGWRKFSSKHEGDTCSALILREEVRFSIHEPASVVLFA
jgi:hypothetical protein